MRILIVIAIWIGVLGGLAAYMQLKQLQQRGASTATVEVTAPGIFSIEMTPTFDVQGGANPFAVEITEQPAIILKLNGKSLVERKDFAAAGQPIIVPLDRATKSISVGKNEVYVVARVPEDGAALVRGVRVRVFRDGNPIAEKTIWSAPGGPLEGLVQLNVPRALAKENNSEGSP